MSRHKRPRAHLHAVPDLGAPAAGRGPKSAKELRTREPETATDLGLFPTDQLPSPDLPAADREPMTMADILGQLEALGMPAELVAQSRALGEVNAAELRGLLSAATAIVTGDPVAGLLAIWEPLLDRKMTVLDAEIATAEILWTLDGASGDDDLVDGLTRLIEEAEHTGRPEALVMCRMLTHLGPPEIHGLATRAANTLAGGGIRDRAWVSSLGKVVFDRAYGFTDGVGQALVVEFAYGRRRHALVILVDHDEGGVVGLHATDDVAELLGQVHREAREHGVSLRAFSAGEAADGIRSALAQPLRPEDEDDEAEMEGMIPIVMERLRHLPQPGETDHRGLRPADGDWPPPGVWVPDFVPPDARAKVVHRIKVTVAGIKPPIWRRLEVPSDMSLFSLHKVLQHSFGWNDTHRWQFTAAGQVYGIGDIGVTHRDARRATVGEVVPRKGATVEYLYDFGDRWVHRIRVEEVGPGELDTGYPRCLAGRRAGPRQDSGRGWDDDEEIDPAGFVLDELNDRLSALTVRRRRR